MSKRASWSTSTSCTGQASRTSVSTSTVTTGAGNSIISCPADTSYNSTPTNFVRVHMGPKFTLSTCKPAWATWLIFRSQTTYMWHSLSYKGTKNYTKMCIIIFPYQRIKYAWTGKGWWRCGLIAIWVRTIPNHKGLRLRIRIKPIWWMICSIYCGRILMSSRSRNRLGNLVFYPGNSSPKKRAKNELVLMRPK